LTILRKATSQVWHHQVVHLLTQNQKHLYKNYVEGDSAGDMKKEIERINKEIKVCIEFSCYTKKTWLGM
jgi:hypothetical protein